MPPAKRIDTVGLFDAQQGLPGGLGEDPDWKVEPRLKLGGYGASETEAPICILRPSGL